MKPNMISAAVILSALTATAALATEGADYAPIYLDKTAITLDAGYMMDIDGLTVDSLTGGSISMSYVFNRTDKSAHSIGLIFGYFEGDDDGGTYIDTGFNEIEMTDPEVIFATQRVQYDATETFSQEILPIVVSYKYRRNITDSISCYVGARAGVYISKTKASRRSSYTRTLGAINITGETRFKSSLSDENSEVTHTSISPTFGMELGVEYQFAKNWSWYLGGSLDASFNMIRECTFQEHSNDGLNAVAYPEHSRDTAVSATIRTGFSYQF